MVSNSLNKLAVGARLFLVESPHGVGAIRYKVNTDVHDKLSSEFSGIVDNFNSQYAVSLFNPSTNITMASLSCFKKS